MSSLCELHTTNHKIHFETIKARVVSNLLSPELIYNLIYNNLQQENETVTNFRLYI